MSPAAVPPNLDAVAAAVEYVESGGQWWARNGCHRGVMQVCTRWAHVPAAWLWYPEVNRAEGRRLLTYWWGKSGHRWAYALAAYNCGWRGLKGKCGTGYARAVLRKVLKNPPKPALDAPKQA